MTIKKKVKKKQTKKMLLVNVRMSESIKRLMQRQANKYTDGNLSEWIKIAATQYELDEHNKG